MPPEMQQDTLETTSPRDPSSSSCCVTKIMPTAHQSSGACKDDVMSCKRKLAMLCCLPSSRGMEHVHVAGESALAMKTRTSERMAEQPERESLGPPRLREQKDQGYQMTLNWVRQ